MKFKRLISLIMSFMMLFTITSQPVLAANIQKKSEVTLSLVTAAKYQDVEDKIAVAHETTVVPQETGNIYYYWGNNSFVVKDSNGYYFVEYNDTFTQFSVNGKIFNASGKLFEVSREGNEESTLAITYPTSWSTMYDTNNSFDVGGLPHSVVGGLIGAAVGTLAPSGGISTIVGTVVGALAGMFLGGVFPIDYKITVKLYKRYRILEPSMPTVIEYYERTAVYGGPSDNLYESELYYNTDTYTREYWE